MNTVDFVSGNVDPAGLEMAQLEQRRRLAELLMVNSTNGGPVYSNKAGIARALTGLLAGMESGSVNRRQSEIAEQKQASRKQELEQIMNTAQGGDRSQLARLLVQSSNPQLSQAGLGMLFKGDKEEEPYTLSPGQVRYGRGGQVVAAAPDKPEPSIKRGETRKIIKGGEEVQQEWDGSGWAEIGRGSRWQPHQAPQPDRTLVEIQDPKNPQGTILVPRDQATGRPGAQSVTGARASREDSDGLRKEFNALPVVQNFNEVRPIIESARKAPNTPQGDFALIYGVGKVLDPKSVVREGEMNMVIGAGSPAQRVQGFLAQLQGKGRLTPEMRAELMTVLDQRAGEYERNYSAARQTYEGIAKQRGHDPAQIFTDISVAPQGAPKIGTVVDGFRFKGGNPKSADSWEKA